MTETTRYRDSFWNRGYGAYTAIILGILAAVIGAYIDSNPSMAIGLLSVGVGIYTLYGVNNDH